MNFSRTKILDEWRNEIEDIIQRRLSNLSNEQFNETFTCKPPDCDDEEEFDVYWMMTEDQKSLCRQILSQYYSSFFDQIHESNNWYFLVSTLSTYLNNSRPKTELKISSEAEYAITLNLGWTKDEISSSYNNYTHKIFWSKNVIDDLIMVSDSNLLDLISSGLYQKSPLEKVKFLENLRSRIYSYSEKHEDLDFINFKNWMSNYGNDRVEIVLRNRFNLFKSIDNSILIVTPYLEFISNAQIKMLESEVTNIAHITKKECNSEWLIARFKYLVSIRSTCLNKSDLKPFNSQENITSNSKSAAIIRHLIQGIISFNSKYKSEKNLKDLRIWIGSLFGGMSGFSQEAIKKALQRKI